MFIPTSAVVFITISSAWKLKFFGGYCFELHTCVRFFKTVSGLDYKAGSNQQAGGRQLQSGSTHNLFTWCSSTSQRRERLKALRTKHLEPPADRCIACDNARFDSLQITKEDILRALGSSGGPVPHRLTPQHLTDLLASSTDDNWQQALWTLSTRCWQDPLGKESTPSSSAYRSVKERWQNPANLSAAP